MIPFLVSSSFLVGFCHAISLYEITGNLTYWDSIFASRTPSIVLSSSNNQHNLSWPEGPVWLEEKSKEQVTDLDLQQKQQQQQVQKQHHLIFSDVIKSKIFNLNLENKNLTIALDNSGDAPLEGMALMAEPGSNGMALLPASVGLNGGDGASDDDRHRWLVVCQHGARRIALLDFETGQRVPLVTHAPNGKRLNGPNDVIVNEEKDGTYVYFTDPVYAWMEKERYEDLPYLDDRVKNQGPGYCGVYRSRVDNVHLHTSIENKTDGHDNVELVAKMDRPNGIGFLKGSNTLVVSDCCQGTHRKDCQQGTSRWNLFKPGSSTFSYDSQSWEVFRVIEDRQAEGYYGCADGFEAILNSRGEDVLVAACAGGICLIDIQDGKVVARLWTTALTATGVKERCFITNVSVTLDCIYLTGSCGILQFMFQKVHE